MEGVGGGSILEKRRGAVGNNNIVHHAGYWPHVRLILSLPAEIATVFINKRKSDLFY